MKTKAEFLLYRGTKIELGWPVRVLPSAPGKQDGFDSLIKSIDVDSQTNRPLAIGVIDPYNGAFRAFVPKRIEPYLRNIEAKKEAILKHRRAIHNAAISRMERGDKPKRKTQVDKRTTSS